MFSVSDGPDFADKTHTTQIIRTIHAHNAYG